MIANIIKVAFRNLFKHFGYSFINILGLAIGLASTIFIFLYVINELTYDRFHEKSDRIYRVWILGNMPGTEMRHAVSSPPMMEAMLMDYPEVESAVRMHKSRGWLVRSGDRKFLETEREYIFADSTFFDVFSFKLLQGNPKTCLRDPRSIVLTEEYANKYFGDEDPMGKTFRIEQDTNFYSITGVMQDLPVNSHIQFKMLGSLSTIERSRSTNWVSHNFHTYFVSSSVPLLSSPPTLLRHVGYPLSLCRSCRPIVKTIVVHPLLMVLHYRLLQILAYPHRCKNSRRAVISEVVTCGQRG